MNPFSELYKSLSDKELLKIIHAHADYQPEAVEAARNEMENRKLSDQQVTEALADLETERMLDEKIQRRNQAIEQKVNSMADSVLGALHPNLPTDSPVERSIKRMVLAFGALAIYHVYHDIPALQFYFSMGTSDLDPASLVLFLGSILFLPVATVLFWMERRLGWIMLTTYATYSAAAPIVIYSTFHLQDTIQYANVEGQVFEPPFTYVMTSLLFVGALWILNKRSLKEKFRIQSIVGWLPYIFVLVFGILLYGAVLLDLTSYP